MINFKNYNFFYDPFPHCTINEFLEPDVYINLCKEFPNIDFLKKIKEKKSDQNKFEKFRLDNLDKNKSFFIKNINSKNTLNNFYEYINSNQFLNELINFLMINHIDLRININKKFIEKILNKIRKRELFIDFEFSSISVDGGFISPHTDGGNKILGFVIPIIDNDEILKIENIGTKIYSSNSDEYKYNFYNKTVPHENAELIKIMPFEKNIMSLHVKTFNSLHGVGPLTPNTGNKTLFRKSISMFLSRR